jgi:transcription antitermination factor NusG
MSEVSDNTKGTPPSAWATFVVQEYVSVEKSYMSIEKEMHSIMGDHVECFIPVSNHVIASREILVTLFEGYSFACHDGKSDFERRAKSVKGTYIAGPLVYNGRLSYVSGKEIEKYRNMLKEVAYTFTPEVGDIVEGVEGMFTSMVGIVLSVDLKSKSADVRFKTKTREVVAKSLSFIALKLKEDIY